MTQERVDASFKIFLKFLHAVLLGVTIPLVIYSTKLVKNMYDFVQATKQTDLRQDALLVDHSLKFGERQRLEQGYDKEIAMINYKLTFIIKFLKLDL